jgi:hypothetical protein
MIFLLDNPPQIPYDKDYTKKAMKKRSTVGYLSERTVHRLKGGLGEAIGR